MEGIGTRLGDSVHTTTREARLTDIEGSDDDLQSIDCFQRDCVLTRRAEAEDVVIHSTVDLEAIEAVISTCEGAITIGLRSQLSDVHDATRDGRDTLDILTGEGRTSARLLSVELVPLSTSDDDGGELLGVVLELDVEGLRFAEGETDVLDLSGLIADIRDRQCVGSTWAHTYDAEVPLGVGDRAVGRSGRQVFGDNAGADECLLGGRVGDRTVDCRGRYLRPYPWGGEGKEGKHQETK